MLITQCPILRLLSLPFCHYSLFGRSASRRAFRYIFARFISPRSQIPVPNSQFPILRSRSPFPTPLAKDAASIPNALAMSTELRALGSLCQRTTDYRQQTLGMRFPIETCQRCHLNIKTHRYFINIIVDASQKNEYESYKK